MNAWVEEYNRLPLEAQARIQTWIQVQRLIASTFKLSFEAWFEHYLSPSLDNPLDYSFAEPVLGDYSGLHLSVSFSRDIDPCSAQTARVPVRARNHLGRLSPELQDQITVLLAPAPSLVPPINIGAADVGVLQKIFPAEKALARLRRPDFRRVILTRTQDDIVISVAQGADLLKLSVRAFSEMMARALV